MYEGVEYVFEQKPKSFISTKYFMRMIIEFVILLPMVPPKFILEIESLPIALFEVGLGFGK